VQILEGLAQIVNEITGIKTEQVVPQASFVDDLDIDSLSMVEVAVAAEEKFGVRIPDEALAKLKTVGDAVAFIQTQGVHA
jgi:acyl carrier protein